MTDSTWLILKDHPLTCRGPNIKQTCNRPLNRLLAVWGWYHSSNLYRIAFKPIKEFDLDLRSEKNAFRGKEIKVIFTLLYFTLTWRWRELSFQRRKTFPSTIPSWLFAVKSVTPSGSRWDLAPPRTQLVNVPDFGTSPWVWAKSGVRGRTSEPVLLFC